MKLYIRLAALALSLAGWTAPALAQTGTQTASINASIGVTLTPKCYFDTSTALDFTGITYVAFSTNPVTSTKTANISCTRASAFTATVQWDTATAGTTSNSAGIVAGLQYTIAATRGTVTNGTALTYSAGTFGGGTAATASVSATLTLPAGQPGDTAATTTATRTLTVAF
jgi:hypothetical protein